MVKSVYESSAYVYLIAKYVGADIIRPLKAKSQPRQKIFEKSSKKFLTRLKRCGKLKKLLRQRKNLK